MGRKVEAKLPEKRGYPGAGDIESARLGGGTCPQHPNLHRFSWEPCRARDPLQAGTPPTSWEPGRG